MRTDFKLNAINIQLVIIQKTKNRESSWEKDKQNEQFVFSLTQLCKNLTQHWHGRCANVIYLELVIFKHPLTGKKKGFLVPFIDWNSTKVVYMSTGPAERTTKRSLWVWVSERRAATWTGQDVISFPNRADLIGRLNTVVSTGLNDF